MDEVEKKLNDAIFAGREAVKFLRKNNLRKAFSMLVDMFDSYCEARVKAFLSGDTDKVIHTVNVANTSLKDIIDEFETELYEVCEYSKRKEVW